MNITNIGQSAKSLLETISPLVSVKEKSGAELPSGSMVDWVRAMLVIRG